jgi:hypothetical protein
MAYVVNGSPDHRQVKQCEGLRLLRDVPDACKTFSLGRRVVIIDNAVIKARLSGRIDLTCAAKRIRIEGTAPAHDPV